LNTNGSNQSEGKKSKLKNQIIFVSTSFFAIVCVCVIAYFALNKIKNDKNSDSLSQDQFEGIAEVSSQLQIECQKSAVKLSETQDPIALETEYRQNAENCKDVYFAIETDTAFRKEGMYADLVVDIARLIAKTDKPKAIELLKDARSIKSWDFYLGPVSCDSQHVLDAYIESFSQNEEKVCYTAGDIKSKVSPEIQNKNFSILTKMISSEDVVWLGIPESDAGCPEKISAVITILKKLTAGSIAVEESQADENNGNNEILNIKLSDKENVTLVFSEKQSCLNLSSVLVPNLEALE
jgi:hypothetical protein